MNGVLGNVSGGVRVSRNDRAFLSGNFFLRSRGSAQPFGLPLSHSFANRDVLEIYGNLGVMVAGATSRPLGCYHVDRPPSPSLVALDLLQRRLP